MQDGTHFLATRLQQRAANTMSETGDLALAYADAINLSLGDPDLTTDARIIEAMRRDCLAGNTHYTETLGQTELRQAILAHTEAHYGLRYDLDECMVTASANHGMWLVFQTVLNPGDEVLVIEPYFTPYAGQIRMGGGTPVFVPTRAEDGFVPTRADLEAALTARTRAIIVNSPTNPTGVVWSTEQLQVVADLATRHDLLVLADDIYTIFDFARPFRSIVTLPGMAERTVHVHSFSKNYCMAGFRIGYLLGPRAIIGAARDVNEDVVFTAPSPSQRAALAALRLHDEICPPIRERFRRRLQVAVDEVARTPRMHADQPLGSIYLWVDIRDTDLTSAEAARRLFSDTHVATLPGTVFGASGEGFLRLAVTVDEDRIRAAFARIRATKLFG